MGQAYQLALVWVGHQIDDPRACRAVASMSSATPTESRVVLPTDAQSTAVVIFDSRPPPGFFIFSASADAVHLEHLQQRGTRCCRSHILPPLRASD